MTPWVKTIVIDGIEIICDPSDAVIDGPNLSSEMDRVSGQIAFWGSALSSAVRERDVADATYRTWRARAYKAIMERDPKLPEYKIKALCEEHSSFLEHKTRMATAAENVVLCESFKDAFEKKANQLQSRGATKRLERSRSTVRTKDLREDDDVDFDGDDDEEPKTAPDFPVAKPAAKAEKSATGRKVSIPLLSEQRKNKKR